MQVGIPERKGFKSLAAEWDRHLKDFFERWGREVSREVRDPRSETPVSVKTYETSDGVNVEISGSPSEIDDVQAILDGHKPTSPQARLDGENMPIASFLRRHR